jgi:hypothetical protein
MAAWIFSAALCKLPPCIQVFCRCVSRLLSLTVSETQPADRREWCYICQRLVPYDRNDERSAAAQHSFRNRQQARDDLEALQQQRDLLQQSLAQTQQQTQHLQMQYQALLMQHQQLLAQGGFLVQQFLVQQAGLDVAALQRLVQRDAAKVTLLFGTVKYERGKPQRVGGGLAAPILPEHHPLYAENLLDIDASGTHRWQSLL